MTIAVSAIDINYNKKRMPHKACLSRNSAVSDVLVFCVMYEK